MGQQSKHIDNLFKDELGSYAETPPPMAWDALEKKLDMIPPKGQVYVPGNALYIVMISSLLLLSVSAAKKLFSTKTTSAYASAELSAGDSHTQNNLLNNNRPTNQSINGQATGTNTIQSSANNQSIGNSQSSANNQLNGKNPAPNQFNNSIADNNGIKGNSKRSQKNPIQVYKKLSPVKALKNDRYAANSAAKGETGAYGKDESVSVPSEKEYSAAKSAGNEKDELALQTPKDEGNKQKTSHAPEPKNNEKINEVPKPKPQPAPKPHFVRFEAGIKAGYEGSVSNNGARKVVVSPYVQYNLSSKFSVMVQPAIKRGTIQSSVVGATNSYYKENNDSTVSPAVKDPNGIYVPGIGWYALWRFKYSQTYDSIAKNYSVGGSYTEYELPVLLKYNIAHGVSVYGGVNLVYSKNLTVKGNSTTTVHTKVDSNQIVLQQIEITTPPNVPVPPVNQVLQYTGTEISNYKDPYPTTTTNSVRAGYMLGFSYEYKKRWLFDGLMQQVPAPANVQGGTNINSTLSSTYFRFTLGYKLIK